MELLRCMYGDYIMGIIYIGINNIGDYVLNDCRIFRIYLYYGYYVLLELLWDSIISIERIMLVLWMDEMMKMCFLFIL